MIFWRALYWLISCSLFINILSVFLLLIGYLLGDRASRWLTKVLAYVCSAAIPYLYSGYEVLHASRLYWQLRRRQLKALPFSSRMPSHSAKGPLRVGVLGMLIGKAPVSLYKAIPGDMEIYAFDILNNKIGYHAQWLSSLVKQHTPLILNDILDAGWLVEQGSPDFHPIITEASLTRDEMVQYAADVVNRADLDLLLIIGCERESQIYRVLDGVNTTSIFHFCNSSDILHHEKVDCYLYTQPESGYYIKQEHIFSAATQTPFNDKVVYPARLYYDPRTLDLQDPTPAWSERDSLILFHGPLYKLANSLVLEIIFALLQEDSTLEFVFMGQTGVQNQELKKIATLANDYGVQAQVNYLGYYKAWWDVTGTKVGPEWDKIVSYLKRARLEPNPFPLGGGQARFQAYATGLPSVHMGVRFDLKRGWMKQPGWVEVPALLVPMGTAYSKEEYISLCRRCLYDEDFANRLAAEQLAVARRVSDPAAYWQQILDAYEDWTSHHMSEHVGQ